jgi:hypothetical protein
MLWNVQRLYGFWLPLWYFQALLYIYVMRSYPVHGEMYSRSTNITYYKLSLRIFFKHEDASMKMFQHMIDTNKELKDAFEKEVHGEMYSRSTTGRWCVSPNTPLSSTKTNNRHDITDILLKVALKHHQPKPNPFIFTFPIIRSFMKRLYGDRPIHALPYVPQCHQLFV